MNTSSVHPLLDPSPATNLTSFQNNALTLWYILGSTFSVVFGLATHCYVLWLIFSTTRNSLASELFFINMSISEILFSIFSGVLLQVVINPSLQLLWHMGLLRFLTGNFITIRPLFQCLMCFERYLAVVHPVTFLKYKPLRYRLFCCFLVWIVGLVSCLLCLIVLNGRSFMWFSFFQFLFFFSAQLFCLVTVLRVLKQSGPGEGAKEHEENQAKKRAFNIIVTMTVTMLIFIVPFLISRFINIAFQKDIEEVGLFSLWCFVLAGFVPSVLYLRRVRKMPFFRR